MNAQKNSDLVVTLLEMDDTTHLHEIKIHGYDFNIGRILKVKMPGTEIMKLGTIDLILNRGKKCYAIVEVPKPKKCRISQAKYPLLANEVDFIAVDLTTISKYCSIKNLPL